MGEYQYFEFLAIDSPLTNDQLERVSGYSSRAVVTPYRFQNVYNFGNFRGNSTEFLRQFFDVMVYVANLGTRRLMFNLPRSLAEDLASVRPFQGETLSIRSFEDCFIVDINFNEAGGVWEQGEGWIDCLASLRAEWISGDLRSAYLAWLADVQAEIFDQDAEEPPVPAGLNKLTQAQSHLVEFLQIDRDLLNVAVSTSPSTEMDPGEIRRWIAAQSEATKEEWLFQAFFGNPGHIAGELRRRYRQEHPSQRNKPKERRRVSELLKGRDELAEKRRAEEARKAAEQHAEKLAGVSKNREALWSKILSLGTAGRSSAYDEAAQIAQDLRELARHEGREQELRESLEGLYAENRIKTALVTRLKRRGILP